jgi:hypothetical protein
MSCGFWRDEIRCRCSVVFATLLTDGTIDLTSKVSGLSGNISKPLIAQATTAAMVNACNASGINDFLAANGVTNVGGVLNKYYPPSATLGSGNIVGEVPPYSTSYSSITAEFMKNAAIAEMALRGASWSELTLTTISTNLSWTARWNSYDPVGDHNRSVGTWAGAFVGEHPEGGTFPMSETEINATILPFLNAATESEIYDLLTDCTTGNLYSFVDGVLA